jgi:cellulose biosynthesis protein BcsQ
MEEVISKSFRMATKKGLVMERSWRILLETQIQDTYIQGRDEWFDMNLSTNGQLNLTIVSEKFKKSSLLERKEQIKEMLLQLHIPLSIGFLSSYTIQEAASIGLSRQSGGDNPVYSWHDLANWAANTEAPSRVLTHQPRIPRTITFYSFKGGVGRTTAITHVAAILAMRGRKVVAVDLDLEAPGLSSALNLHPLPQYGIVDYFYERSYMPQNDDIKPDISIAEIFGEVFIPNASGRLFVVPAGSLNLDYIAKVDDLRANTITAHGEDLWSIFFREINEQLQPDLILVDSRTGINQWSAFSLLRAADKAIIFLYANEQNRQGIDLILEALSGKVSLQLVFSPVPFGESGADEEKSENQVDIVEPITIQYLTELASASNYPVLSLLSHYTCIANVADEDTTAINSETDLAD